MELVNGSFGKLNICPEIQDLKKHWYITDFVTFVYFSKSWHRSAFELENNKNVKTFQTGKVLKQFGMDLRMDFGNLHFKTTKTLPRFGSIQ